jgi:hypothetical protein
VQVRSRAPARAACGAEALARSDLLADADSPVRQVGVERDVSAAEPDLDEVSVALEAPHGADGDHASRLRGADDGRAEDADVDPGVRAPAVDPER